MKKLTTEEFIFRSNNVHNNFYTYENSSFINVDTKVNITCPNHGSFTQRPDHHMAGRKCKKCSSKRSNEKQNNMKNEFIKKCLLKYTNNEYNYDNLAFSTYQTKTTFICKIHGQYDQTPENHINHGCLKCSHEKRLLKTLEDRRNKFITDSNIIHDNFYSYDEVDYKNNKTNVMISCPIHGPFFQRPTNHLLGRGCMECNSYSKCELKIKYILDEKNINYEYQKSFRDFKNIKTGFPYRFDFFLPDSNIIIEYDGEHHYKPVEIWGGEEYLKMVQYSDNIKNEYCEKNSIRLLRISYKEKNRILEKINEVI